MITRTSLRSVTHEKPIRLDDRDTDLNINTVPLNNQRGYIDRYSRASDNRHGGLKLQVHGLAIDHRVTVHTRLSWNGVI